MSTTARTHYWDVVNDDTMDSQGVDELISLLQEYSLELSAKEAPLEEGL